MWFLWRWAESIWWRRERSWCQGYYFWSVVHKWIVFWSKFASHNLQISLNFVIFADFYRSFTGQCWYEERSFSPGQTWQLTVEIVCNLLIPSMKFAKWIIREGFLRSFFSSILVNVYWNWYKKFLKFFKMFLLTWIFESKWISSWSRTFRKNGENIEIPAKRACSSTSGSKLFIFWVYLFDFNISRYSLGSRRWNRKFREKHF